MARAPLFRSGHVKLQVVSKLLLLCAVMCCAVLCCAVLHATGQKQRIASMCVGCIAVNLLSSYLCVCVCVCAWRVARAILKNPPILLLDEVW